MAFASAVRGTEATSLLLETARRFGGLDVAQTRHTYLEAFASAVFVGRFAAGTGLTEVAKAAWQAPPAEREPAPPDLLLDGLALLCTDGFGSEAGPVRR
jgi:hypothetical protein